MPGVEAEILSANTGLPTKRHLVVLRNLMRLALTAVITTGLLWALGQAIAGYDRAAFDAALRAIPPQNILAALLLTCASYLAIARYDLLAAHFLRIPLAPGRALAGGYAAAALSQSLGFGFFTGSFVRWRFYRGAGLSGGRAALITGAVIAGFMTGFALVLAALLLIAPGSVAGLLNTSPGLIQLGAALTLLCGAALPLVKLLTPAHHMLSRALPPWPLLVRQVMLAAADVIPAGLAFWMLLPVEIAPDALLILPVYLTAYGLGLLSNTPGGVGAVELTCLAALAHLPTETVLAALALHRGIYYLLPALIAGALLLRNEIMRPAFAPARPAPMVPPAPVGAVPDQVAPLLEHSHRAETGLARLGDKGYCLTPCGGALIMAAEGGSGMIGLGDPVGPRSLWSDAAQALSDRAQSGHLFAFHYRIGAHFAHMLRLKGYAVQQIGVEARLPLTAYEAEGRDRRELRRKLRQAEKAGLHLHHHPPGSVDLARFAPLARDSEARQGKARGFSMGRYDADYLARFDLIEARRDDTPVGLLSLWRSGDGGEWSIDVMLTADDCPSGTMHALVHEAALMARSEGAHHLSLCAVPFDGLTGQSPGDRILRWLFEKRPHWHGAQGLKRFKGSFRPVWEPRYAAAQGPVALWMGLIETGKLIAPRAKRMRLGAGREKRFPLPRLRFKSGANS